MAADLPPQQVRIVINVNNFFTCYSLMMKLELSKRLIKIKYENVFFSIGSFTYYKVRRGGAVRA